MTTQFNLRSFRILAVGGAKASTNGNDDGTKEEPDQKLYFPG